MIRDIHQRLEKLESLVPRQRSFEDELLQFLRNLLFLSVAFYLGYQDEEESVMQAYERALGYSPGSPEFRFGAKPNADYWEKKRLAERKLLEKFGVTWNDDSDAIIDAFELMETGLPKHYTDILPKNIRKQGSF